MLLKFCPIFLFIIPVIGCAQKKSGNKNWSGSAAGYYYFIPEENIPPTIIGSADINSLHLEGRYNYEDVNSGSVFAGYSFSTNKKLDINVTPMAGIVAGNSNGILPGLEAEVSYKSFYFYSENEYMLDFKGKENYFFYSWTELNAEVLKNIRTGVLAQSLRLYKTAFDIQRGVYAEYNVSCFTFDVYYFNPFSNYSFFTTALTIDF